MTNWDKRFIELAEYIAQWSKYKNRKVGAVIVDHKNRVISMGYNGWPRGAEDEGHDELYDPKVKYYYVEHAERNAIYNSPISVEGCRMYLPWFPCTDCARAIIQCGITEVICRKPDFNDPDFGEGFKISLELFEECNVKVTWYHD